MDLARGEAGALQRLVELTHRRLAVREDDPGFDIFLAQQRNQPVALLGGGDMHQPLLDIDIGGGGARDLDRLGIFEEFVGELLDRRRHRRREEQGLARLGQFGADFLDIGDEPHVEHPVGLVDHQHRTARQQDFPAAEQIHQPAGRGDQDVDALFERGGLVAHRYAADQQRHRELVIFAVFLEILSDLRGEFARRLKDQGARHPGAAAALAQNVDHRQHERSGLAGAGLCDGDKVAAHQDRRDRARLDRSRFGIARLIDGALEFIGKAEVGKSHAVSGKCVSARAPGPAKRLPIRREMSR